MEPGQSHNEKVDVWSYGMVLYEITTNRIPYDDCENEMQIIDQICDEKKTSSIPEGIEIHPTLLKLMNQCWDWNSQRRPSFSEIVQTLKNSIDKPLTSQNNTNTKK
jgi:sterile alpha motif and leucine zipper-containing kinase AZK